MTETLSVCSVRELPQGSMRLVEWEDLEILLANFELASGRPLCLPACEPVDTFPVRVNDGEVLVEVE